MKTFNNLTEEQRVLLTTEQVEYYAKIDCANRGIIIPQKPINQTKAVVLPTKKYYKLGYESFVFETEKDAQDYLDAKNKSFTIKSIGNQYDSKNQYITDNVDSYKEISSIILYTKEEAENLGELIKYNIEITKEWNDYNEGLKEYNNIVSYILDNISEINFLNSRKVFYDKVYSDYLELANGDDNIAFTFFDKAYRTANLSDIDRSIVDIMLVRVDECLSAE